MAEIVSGGRPVPGAAYPKPFFHWQGYADLKKQRQYLPRMAG